MAAETSDSVGFLLETSTDVKVVALGVPPVDEYFTLALTDGMTCSSLSRLDSAFSDRGKASLAVHIFDQVVDTTLPRRI